MEKKKFNLENYQDTCVEKKIVGTDGTEIIVRNHISYADKENMVQELARICMIIHDEYCVYVSYEIDKVQMALIAKYYTNIDTENIDINDIADFLINNDMYKSLYNIIEDDYNYVLQMFWCLIDSIDISCKEDGSITKALRTSFGFLFNGEDITESLAKAEATKNTIYDAVSAWKRVEKDKEDNIDNGRLKVGGNLINFAKKPE